MIPNPMSKLAFFEDHKPEKGSFLDDTIQGLSQTPKSLHPKYLYDARGARLFQDICLTDEYYITRVEMSLIKQAHHDIKKMAGKHARLVEFGMGEGVKARLLLEMIESPSGFIGIDISREQLRQQLNAIAEDFPNIEIGGICADFFKLTQVPKNKNGGRDIGFFPGSTIGNFMPDEQARLLRNMHQALNVGNGLIIGVDLKKNIRTISNAYDDEAGATAAFSLNLLSRINRELNGNFDENGFAHEAVYNQKCGRIEICLRSLRDQTPSIGKRQFPIKKGEAIHTEKAYKFSIDQFYDLVKKESWEPRKSWVDENQFFSIHWLEAV